MAYSADLACQDVHLLTVLEHSSPKYAPRTWDNAQGADLTIAFALDFETMGELLTRKAAGVRYVARPLADSWLSSARVIYSELRRRDGRTLNIAGNGMATLAKFGWSQAAANQTIFNIMAIVTKHWHLERIACGGQSGVDLAGAVAGVALGIPTVMTLPSGYLQRDASGRDRQHTRDEIVSQVATGLADLCRAGTPISAAPCSPIGQSPVGAT